MASFKNVDQWMHLNGGRPRVGNRDSQWLKGPFSFTTAMVAAASTEVQLNTATVITSDPQVDAAYGTSAIPKAVLRIEGFQIIFQDDAFRTATDADKQAIYEQLRLRHKDGTTTRLYQLGTTIYEPYYDALEVAASAGAVSQAMMRGHGPLRLAQPIEVSLERDELAIAVHAATLGAAYACTLRVWGFIFPDDAKRHRSMGSGRCPHGSGMSSTEAIEVTTLQSTLAIDPALGVKPVGVG
jgi:hypothetical protein